MRFTALLIATVLVASAQAPPPGPPRKVRGTGLLTQAGAADKHIVDDAAAERGRKGYIQDCITCHGPTARGSNSGPDIVRSVLMLKDRYGSTLGPFLRKGHPTQTTPPASFTDAQIQDLSDFIHLKVEETLRLSPNFHAQNVLTGDAKAGEAFFNGAGKCNTCHSVTGNLKGIGSKYEPIDLQQKFLFPRPSGFAARNAKQVMVTVTTPSGQTVAGVLDKLDDFNVSLRDSAGEYHGFARGPKLTVKVDDPYQAHADLLDVYTDRNMHDLTAYLETLK